MLPHHNLIHLLYGIGAIVIEPSGDDGAESVDEEGGFIVAGRVIGCCFKICSELLVIAFDDSKEPREVLCSIASIDTCIREHIHNYVLDSGFIFLPHFISSSVRRIISGAIFFLSRFTMTLYIG